MVLCLPEKMHMLIMGELPLGTNYRLVRKMFLEIGLPWPGGFAGWGTILYTNKVVGLIPAQAQRGGTN